MRACCHTVIQVCLQGQVNRFNWPIFYPGLGAYTHSLIVRHAVSGLEPGEGQI